MIQSMDKDRLKTHLSRAALFTDANGYEKFAPVAVISDVLARGE
jgi:hypothetical protein